MFDFNKWQRQFRWTPEMRGVRILQRITCADGFSLSVQAGYTMYSSPRDRSSFYESVEVGFPSAREEALMPYCESPDKPTETVYGYVPVEIVNAIIDAHGGLQS